MFVCLFVERLPQVSRGLERPGQRPPAGLGSHRKHKTNGEGRMHPRALETVPGARPPPPPSYGNTFGPLGWREGVGNHYHIRVLKTRLETLRDYTFDLGRWDNAACTSAGRMRNGYAELRVAPS